MCGIFCCVKNTGFCFEHLSDCLENLKHRGPENCSQHSFIFNNKIFEFFGSILWLQGSSPVYQPLVDSGGNVLLWNGDIFDQYNDLKKIELNDTQYLLDQLTNAPNVLDVIGNIKGPFSFIYWSNKQMCLWFGRDYIGRHSLLWKINDGLLLLTSVATKIIGNIQEVPAYGIFRVNFTKGQDMERITLHPWYHIKEQKLIDLIAQYPSIKISDEKLKSPFEMSCDSKEPGLQVKSLLEELSRNNSQSNFFQELFDNEKIVEKLKILKILLMNSIEKRVNTQPFLCNKCLQRQLLSDSVISDCFHSSVGILFSGGVDSAVLTVLADRYVPENQSIDLINVAFEHSKQNGEKKGNCRKERRKMSKNDNELPQIISGYNNVPDRITGLQTFEELKMISPNRKWNFIKVNVPQSELSDLRERRICNVIYPLSSVLDDSLGCAMWFAARGKGLLLHMDEENISQEEFYVSPCRILLLGTGADEQLGGYMRHRTVFKHKGWVGLGEEMLHDLCQIPLRNLGRDDRMVADHGKQARMPYLDENVVNFLAELQPWEKCWPLPCLPSGFGDKFLLRMLAWELGLQKAAYLPKRAFQFGSRIANSKENANDISKRL